MYADWDIIDERGKVVKTVRARSEREALTRWAQSEGYANWAAYEPDCGHRSDGSLVAYTAIRTGSNTVR